MKKILILCTGNSCRSIMAEAMINCYFEDIKVDSAGVKPSGSINPNAKKILIQNGYWSEKLYSKDISEILKNDYDLIVTVCDNAKESCPVFPKKSRVMHIGFEDPDGKDFKEFEKCFEDIKNRLLPEISKIFDLKVKGRI